MFETTVEPVPIGVIALWLGLWFATTLVFDAQEENCNEVTS